MRRFVTTVYYARTSTKTEEFGRESAQVRSHNIGNLSLGENPRPAASINKHGWNTGVTAAARRTVRGSAVKVSCAFGREPDSGVRQGSTHPNSERHNTAPRGRGGHGLWRSRDDARIKHAQRRGLALGREPEQEISTTHDQHCKGSDRGDACTRQMHTPGGRPRRRGSGGLRERGFGRENFEFFCICRKISIPCSICHRRFWSVKPRVGYCGFRPSGTRSHLSG